MVIGPWHFTRSDAPHDRLSPLQLIACGLGDRAPTSGAAVKILPTGLPTPEQLAILSIDKPGVLLLKGAAGSGKTTTALLRLRQQCRAWLARRTRLGLTAPVRTLVLTYNRTLEGYIAELARQQVLGSPDLDLTVSTFVRWSRDLLVADGRSPALLNSDETNRLLRPKLAPLELPDRLGLDEVDYVLGRFEHDRLDAYLTAERSWCVWEFAIGSRCNERGNWKDGTSRGSAQYFELCQAERFPSTSRTPALVASQHAEQADASFGKISADLWGLVHIVGNFTPSLRIQRKRRTDSRRDLSVAGNNRRICSFVYPQEE